ncbi:hypothetical protein QFZ94_009038 [Paraburkholderia sp. JPY465]|uniref:hypothetical protein n=1 Tax=Paraburkholderia sp. JPY465 TaxID=3042285 RepID=UPI003D1D2D27
MRSIGANSAKTLKAFSELDCHFVMAKADDKKKGSCNDLNPASRWRQNDSCTANISSSEVMLDACSTPNM